MGMVPPTRYKEIDLLKVVRKKFRFPSNKLDYVAQALGLGSKVNHKGMMLWRECMAGDKRAWNTMRKYNIQDVQLLDDLYTVLLPWIDGHPNHGLYIDNPEEPVCPNCGSQSLQKRGVEATRTQRYQRYKCTECGTNARGRLRISTTSANVTT